MANVLILYYFLVNGTKWPEIWSDASLVLLLGVGSVSVLLIFPS